MKRKNMLISALAILAVSVLVGSGIARCSMNRTATNAPETPPVGQTETREVIEGDQVNEDAGVATSTPGQLNGFSTFKNTSWTVEGGTTTLSVIESAFIVKASDSSNIIYYVVKDESQHDDVLSVTLSISHCLTGEQKDTVCTVTETKDGGKRLVCDELPGAFLLDAPLQSSLEITGITSSLTDVFEVSEESFSSVLEQYIVQKSPYATKAVWDEEVWIDFKAQTYLTNFTLNDAASTVVTVIKQADGSMATQ